MIAKRARRGDSRAVDAVHALGRFAIRARFPPGAELMSLAVLLDLDRQRKAARAAGPRACRKLRPAQAASGSEQRQSFKEIRLAGAVLAA